MAKLELTTRILAPVELVFDYSRDIDLHQSSMSHTGERAVDGRTSGLINRGEEVTWEATHFFVRQRFTSRISRMERPHYFRDEMVRGAFKDFAHDHYFEWEHGETLMRDVIEFNSPLGFLGQLVDKVFMTRYLTKLVELRNRVIKEKSEASRGEEQA